MTGSFRSAIEAYYSRLTFALALVRALASRLPINPHSFLDGALKPEKIEPEPEMWRAVRLKDFPLGYLPQRGSGRSSQPQAPVRKAGAFPSLSGPWLFAPSARSRVSTRRRHAQHPSARFGHRSGLHSGNARAHSTRKRLNGRPIPGARILSSAPFRPSGLRGETVSVFRVLTRVLRGYFGNPL